MATRFYSFDYFEIVASEVLNLGILAMSSKKSITKDQLIDHARQHINKSNAQIFLSNVIKITEAEFEKFNQSRQPAIS